MYMNAGYLNHSRVPVKDHSKPLIVTCSGTYRLQADDSPLRTAYPKGRSDFQLLYIASGKTHFMLDGEDCLVREGNMILFRPGEPQRYVYYGPDYPEVYWVHFTGYDVTNILRYYQMDRTKRLFHTGTLPEYKQTFQRMILEIQLGRPLCEELLASLLSNLFLLINRQIIESPLRASGVSEEMERAVAYFSDHYSEKINIQEYAASAHIDKDHFTRSLKKYTGMTPTRYLLSVRMSNAQTMLEQTSYSIGKIAAIVGYGNPLYFSRQFSKLMGISPSEYRAQNQKPDDSST